MPLQRLLDLIIDLLKVEERLARPHTSNDQSLKSYIVLNASMKIASLAYIASDEDCQLGIYRNIKGQAACDLAMCRSTFCSMA